MKWTKSTRHQASVRVDKEIFKILCDGEENKALALSIDGEYVRDLVDLPTHDELVKYIKEYIQLNRLARSSFSGIGRT